MIGVVMSGDEIVDLLDAGASRRRDDALGEDFADVECVVAATSSTGLAGEEVTKHRLFFLLDQAHPIADLHRWARDVPENARKLAARFWPGPLTMVLSRSESVLKRPHGGGDLRYTF